MTAQTSDHFQDCIGDRCANHTVSQANDSEGKKDAETGIATTSRMVHRSGKPGQLVIDTKMEHHDSSMGYTYGGVRSSPVSGHSTKVM